MSQSEAKAKKLRFEEMLPNELESAIRAAPVCYLPLGTLEFHGWHLPVGNDALKAHAICLLAAGRTGGAVAPPTYWGIGGGHKKYFGSVIVRHELLPPLLADIFAGLRQSGFRVIVAITGHYPGEQVELVKGAAAAFNAEHPDTFVWALPEYEAFPTPVGQPLRADHAAKWETSILWELRPELVELDRLAGDEALYGLYGEDPRGSASRELGQETVEGIVSAIAERVRAELGRLGVSVVAHP